MLSPNMRGLKPLMDRKVETVIEGFIGIVNESKPKQNNLRIDQGREFYNNLMQKWLHNNDGLIYLTYNQSK